MNKNNKILIPSSGSIPFGFQKAPVGRINYLDAPLRSPFREMLPEEEREKRFVHFHFMGFASSRFIAGCSLARANCQTTVFFYLFDREKGTMIKRGCRARTEEDVRLSLNPDDGETWITGNGMDIRFTSNLPSLEKMLLVRLDDQEVLNLRFSETRNRFETLRLCTPTGPNGWTYCQKVAGLPAEGILSYEGDIHDLGVLGASAHHDFTAGHLRQDTFWNWACLTGYLEDGRALGLNLSNGVNETGHSENALWIDGKQEAAGLTQFTYDPDDLQKPWTITSDTERIKLAFYPEGAYAAFDKTGDTPFDFTQLFGKFSGSLTTESGQHINIKDIPGFCERQYAIWWY